MSHMLTSVASPRVQNSDAQMAPYLPSHACQRMTHLVTTATHRWHHVSPRLLRFLPPAYLKQLAAICGCIFVLLLAALLSTAPACLHSIPHILSGDTMCCSTHPPSRIVCRRPCPPALPLFPSTCALAPPTMTPPRPRPCLSRHLVSTSKVHTAMPPSCTFSCPVRLLAAPSDHVQHPPAAPQARSSTSLPPSHAMARFKAPCRLLRPCRLGATLPAAVQWGACPGPSERAGTPRNARGVGDKGDKVNNRFHAGCG